MSRAYTDVAFSLLGRDAAGEPAVAVAQTWGTPCDTLCARLDVPLRPGGEVSAR